MAHLLWHYLRDSAARKPDQPAVVGRDLTYTYGELDRWSGQVAAALAAAGIGRGDRVGLYLPKSPHGVAWMLGAAKAGAAYVPADPNQPARRASLIFRDCAVRAVLTTAAKLPGLLTELGDHRPALAVVADGQPPAGLPVPSLAWEEIQALDPAPGTDAGTELDPAYLLYTSGSTGTPKGVILSHRNAMAFVDWAGETLGISGDDRLSSHAPFHFDLSVLDIYAALRSGAPVCLVPEQITAFPVQLARWIADERISVWYSVPSALTRMLLHGDLASFSFPHLRAVLFAGEVFPVKYLRQVMELLRPARFFNLYGPTETNVCTWWALPEALPEDMTDIPIGWACANTDVFALTDDGRVAGDGETGELYVRGPTVLLGYWGLADRTATVRVRNPLQPAFDEPVYRTGDLVQRAPDGTYRFLGRRDHQVKSRGYRIELGEIEQVLYSHPAVRDAVVVALPDDEVGARLFAVTAMHPGAEASRQTLTSHCLKALPRYMVPEQILLWDELPRTSTGKIDRPLVLERVRTETPG